MQIIFMDGRSIVINRLDLNTIQLEIAEGCILEAVLEHP